MTNLTNRTAARIANGYKYPEDIFWKAGFIKETMEIWAEQKNKELLDQTGQIIANTYLQQENIKASKHKRRTT